MFFSHQYPKVGQYWIDLSESELVITSIWCRIDSIDEISDGVWISFLVRGVVQTNWIPIHHLKRYHVPCNKFFKRLYNLAD